MPLKTPFINHPLLYRLFGEGQLHPPPQTAPGKRQLAFVVPWYGEQISGGAEAECRGLVTALADTDWQVEVITTCLAEFAADWNHNVHPAGLEREYGQMVRRFPATTPDRSRFHRLNAEKLMPPLGADILADMSRSPLTAKEEEEFLAGIIQSPAMIRYLSRHHDRYEVLIFMPYMFGTTISGIQAVPRRKSVIIPCLHQERYTFVAAYRQMMAQVGGALFHVPAEQTFAEQLYDLSRCKTMLLGEMVDTDPPTGDGQRFRGTFQLGDGPILLFAGRKIAGKNLPLLVNLFDRLKAEGLPPELEGLKLVLMGKGDLGYGDRLADGIVDLGFLSKNDKYDAFAAATVLAQPSLNESFSIVMMEAWLQGTPALVHGGCAVTKDHCTASGGGLSFTDFASFKSSLTAIVRDREVMAERGKAYVLSHFTKDIVLGRLSRFLAELTGTA